MIRNTSFEIVKISDEYIAVPTGENAITFHGVITLSEPAAFLLNHMDKPRTKDELLDLLLNEYEVDRATLERDFDSIIKVFIEHNLALMDQ